MILVTGSTGLLGSHVVCELVSNGYAVRALYRSESRKRHVKHVLRHYFSDSAGELYDRIDWFEGDILDLSDLEDAMQGCEKVVHCAALVSFHRRDFWHLFEHNRKGTANVVNIRAQPQGNGERRKYGAEARPAAAGPRFLDGGRRQRFRIRRWHPPRNEPLECQ
jgi:nucleoside-diphosphate-sugar epimerase